MATDIQSRRSARATGRVLRAALGLFSRQGFRATSMRQIASRAGVSLGNLYHHFGGKEAIFERLLEQYWSRLEDPELPLNRLFRQARFPDDLEQLARAVEQVVEANARHILLIYIDVIEFRGKHLREFYRKMPQRFAETYAERFRELTTTRRIGNVDPMIAAMVAVRWFFYFHTVEKCFGVPNHFGMAPERAIREFIHLLRLGLLPREGRAAGAARRARVRAGRDRPGR